MAAVANGGRANAKVKALNGVADDRPQYLADPFLPQTPTDSAFPTLRKARPPPKRDDFYDSIGFWNDLITMRWMRVPLSSFKILSVPIILYFNWSLLGLHPTNPFEPLIFLSHRIPSSPDDDPLYSKGWFDLLFIAYYIIVFSFIRQFVILKVMKPIGGYFGIRKIHKLDRFGEQGYAIVYYGAMGIWGVSIMATLPTWWYRTEHFWIDYPHWEMKGSLKRFYLTHLSYWLQQLIVLAIGMEKPRKDFYVLVAHHIVTLWLVGWSYLVNLTYIGNAVFISMDIPDVVFAVSKVFNYLHFDTLKVISFAIFACVWSYFRHYLNLIILWSVWNEFDLMPGIAREFNPEMGFWMPAWMRYQIFAPLALLQSLNLFWYFLILRIIYRAITAGAEGVDDDRSGDEDDGNDKEE